MRLSIFRGATIENIPIEQAREAERLYIEWLELESLLAREINHADSQFDHKLVFSAKGEGEIQDIEEANQ